MHETINKTACCDSYTLTIDSSIVDENLRVKPESRHLNLNKGGQPQMQACYHQTDDAN